MCCLLSGCCQLPIVENYSLFISTAKPGDFIIHYSLFIPGHPPHRWPVSTCNE